MSGVVYMALNKINGKIYIGSTVLRLEDRKKQHLSPHSEVGKKFKKALKKFGSNNFEWKPLDYSHSIKDLRKKEFKWINELRTNEEEFGYNTHPFPFRDECTDHQNINRNMERFSIRMPITLLIWLNARKERMGISIAAQIIQILNGVKNQEK